MADPTTTVDIAAPGVGRGADELLAELGGPSRLWRWIVTPVVLGGICVALYVYVQGQELDRIEVASLNAPMIRQRLIEHLHLTLVSTFFVILIAVPLGIVLTRPWARPVTPLFLGIANIGQAVPSIGVLVLLAVTVGIGFEQAIYALVLYATLPVLRNTMVGLDQVDPSLIEAARGMGLTSRGVLARIELPLAVPVMLAGIRTALVINVGTAALATFIGAGGLGWIINQGNVQNRTPVLLTGSILTAVVALALDWIAGIVEDVLRPKGL
ncbi:MAG TPA: ABC transporter permease [Acidimicrobiales bacterium]|nr:ABC transporter permease [Acidimicrobiales bacterium]